MAKTAVKPTYARLLQLLKEVKAVPAPFPALFKPMLASRVNEIFNDKDWIYEIKWDGYRIMAYKNKESTNLYTRELQDYTKLYSVIADAIRKHKFSFVADGEVIMLDEYGKPSYDDLQRIRTLGQDRLLYSVFDVLWCEGYSLIDVPLTERKKILNELFAGGQSRIINYPFTEYEGKRLLEEMIEKDMEGIVAKKKDSVYIPGKRAKTWLKIPTRLRQEFVIGGWEESESGRQFRSLLFGYYKDGKLYYFGHSGGGYKEKDAQALLEKLHSLETKKCPFENDPGSTRKVHWAEPVLVAEFDYATITRSGKIRKPAIFKGLREDKRARDVRFEKPVRKGGDADSGFPVKKETDPSLLNDKEHSNWPELKRSLSKGSRSHITADGRKIELNNIEKLIWPNADVSKGALIKYYIDLSSYLLPYLQDRPLSLHVKHQGVFEAGMYIKGMEGNQPEWAEVFITERKHKKPGRSDQIDYIVCNDVATMIYLVNLGCIDFNPWNSRISDPLHPDYIIIDLDPGQGSSFEQATEVALAAKSVIETLKLKSLIKTSGKTGLHILIPVENIFSYPDARRAARMICDRIYKKVPDISTLEDIIANRGNKVFLDDNQNDEADTIACAYSVRPYHYPNVSAPISWKEVNSKLSPGDHTLFSILSRLKKKGDLFIKLFDPAIKKRNSVALKKLLSQDLKVM